MFDFLTDMQLANVSYCAVFKLIDSIYSLITFRVRRSREEMYIRQGRLCVCLSVCLSVPRRIPTLLHGPRCNLEE